jgi:hypothetical protein
VKPDKTTAGRDDPGPEQLLALELVRTAHSLRTARQEVCHLVAAGHKAALGDAMEHTMHVLCDGLDVAEALEKLAERVGLPPGGLGAILLEQVKRGGGQTL